MNKWIVIIAYSSAISFGSIATDQRYTRTTNDLVYSIPRTAPPSMTVIFTDTKEDAETQALGYHEKNGVTWVDQNIKSPGLMTLGTGRSAVVIDPAGHAYKVSKKEQKRIVTKQVEESIGWKTEWEEVK